MLTVTQVAKLKGLTPDAVRKALADGRLQGERQGRLWRISQLACDAWEPAPRGTWTPTMQIVAGHGAVKGAKLTFDHDGLDTSERQLGEGHIYRHELTDWSRLVVLVVSAGEASCYELAPDTTPLELEGVVPPYGLRGHARVIKQWHGRGAREAFARARGELGAGHLAIRCHPSVRQIDDRASRPARLRLCPREACVHRQEAPLIT